MQQFASFQDWQLLACLHSPDSPYCLYSPYWPHWFTTFTRFTRLSRICCQWSNLFTWMHSPAGRFSFCSMHDTVKCYMYVSYPKDEDITMQRIGGGAYIWMDFSPVQVGPARWHAYLRRSLSDWMIVQKRFYAWMRLPTFTRGLPAAIFNLQLYIEKILNEFLESSAKCCCGQWVTQ